MEIRIEPDYETMQLRATLFAILPWENILFTHSRPFRLDEEIDKVMIDFREDAYDEFEKRFDTNTCISVYNLPEYKEINTRELKAMKNAPNPQRLA